MRCTTLKVHVSANNSLKVGEVLKKPFNIGPADRVRDVTHANGQHGHIPLCSCVDHHAVDLSGAQSGRLQFRGCPDETPASSGLLHDLRKIEPARSDLLELPDEATLAGCCRGLVSKSRCDHRR